MAEEQKNNDHAKDTSTEPKTDAKKAEGTNDSAADKKSKKPRKTYSNHPSYLDMLTETLSFLDDKDGSSLQAIKRYIVQNFDVDDNSHFNAMLKNSIKKAVAKETLIQTKGKGASGSFKLTNPVQTLLSKPTKRQQAYANAAAEKAAKEEAAARRVARKPKKKKHSSVAKSNSKAGSKAASRRPAPKKKSVKKSKPASKPAAKSKSGRKGRR